MFKKIDLVTIYPVFEQAFSTIEHADGEYEYLGDALGRDFMVEKLVDGFIRRYEKNGLNNEEWFSYNANVFAPCHATVKQVNINPIENVPGKISNKPSTSILFQCEDGVSILYGHLKDVKVKLNEPVSAGQVIGKCGNNGMSSFPHIHVGAWQDNRPLQIRVDLSILGEILKKDKEYYYLKLE